MNPPPISTDPTIAGAASLLAEERGVLREWIVAVMQEEWAEGRDIGDEQTLVNIGARICIEEQALRESFRKKEYLEQLERNWQEAQDTGLIGVPSFQIGDELFWGADRIDYVTEYLDELRLRRM